MTADTNRLDSRLDAACADFGEAIAISDAIESLSYATLAQTAAAYATQLRAEGLKHNEPVLVAVSSHCRDLAAYYGVWKAGGVAVPVHRNATTATIADIATRTKARIRIDGCSGDPQTIAENETDLVSRQGTVHPPNRDILRGAAWIVYTSGSTGIPKGVVHAHDSYIAKLEAINRIMSLPAPGQVLMPLQLIFVYAHWVALTTLLRGGEVVLATPFKPETFMAMLARQPAAAAVVPTMLRALRPLIGGRADAVFSGALMSGGEPLPAELGRYLRTRWPDARLWDIYGLTETATSDFYVSPDDYDRAAGTIGSPAPGVSFRIADETGELQIRTPYLMRGYLDTPEMTAESITDGHFRTGDQAEIRDDGFVMITGRLKDLINRAGNKVSPVEVENAFLEHSDIEQALAAGLPDSLRGESLHLMIVAASLTTLDIEQLREWAAPRLERYKIPDVIHIVPALPQGKTGKADRNVMRAYIIAMRETNVRS